MGTGFGGRWCLLVLSSFVALLSGCGSVPDLTPFADATAEVERGVTRSGDLVEREFAALIARHEDDAELRKLAERFEAAWEARRGVCRAMVEYADGLASVAAAGKAGKETAGKVADSLSKLASAAGAAGMIPSAATELGTVIYGAVAEARAARSLADAIAKADPAVQAIGKLLQEDFLELREGMFHPDEVPAQLERDLKRVAERQRGADLSYRSRLVRRRVELQNMVTSSSTTTTTTATTTTQPTTQPAGLAASIEEVDRLIAATDAWYLPLEQEIRETYERFAAGSQVLQHAHDATGAWAAAHAQLSGLVREGRGRPNVRLLLNTALEMKTVIESMEKP